MADELAIPKKMCRLCAVEKPLTVEHWNRDAHQDDGFRSECKVCRHAEDKLVREREASRDQEQWVENLREAGITQLLLTANAGGSKLPHAAELYQCLVDAFGGPKGIASQAAGLYLDPKTSPVTRQRILQNVISLGQKVSDSGAINRDLKHVPSEELERMLRERVNDEVQGQVLRIHQLQEAQAARASEASAEEVNRAG